MISSVVDGAFGLGFGVLVHRLWQQKQEDHSDHILTAILCAGCAISGVWGLVARACGVGGSCKAAAASPGTRSKGTSNNVTESAEPVAKLPWEVPESAPFSVVLLLLLVGTLFACSKSHSPFLRLICLSWSINLCATHCLNHVSAVAEKLIPSASLSNRLATLLAASQSLFAVVPLTVLSVAGFRSAQGKPFASSEHYLVAFVLSNSYELAVLTHVLLTFLSGSKWLRRVSTHLRAYMCLFFIIFHGFAVVGMWRWFTYAPAHPGMPSRGRLFGEMFILYVLGGLGITAGAHRLWAHRAYKAVWPYRFILMIFNSIATQGNILHWSRDHRLHHRYSEKEPDPHNASKGFFHAHMGWLLTHRHPSVIEGARKTDVSDLLLDSVVVLQDALDPYWNLSWCFLIPSLYVYHFYGDFWLGFFTVGCLRWIFTLHCTWTVNSVAHLWGPRPYNEHVGPVESFVTALVAVGEGWHNWHHQYAFDYATSEHGALRQYNPTKCFIDFFASIGWVWDRKRATRLWEQTKKLRAKRQREAINQILLKASSSSGALRRTLSSSTDLTDDHQTTDCTPTSQSFDLAESPRAEESKGAVALSIATLAGLIPSSCRSISLLKSTAYLLRDLLAAAAISVGCAAMWLSLVRLRPDACPLWQTLLLKLFECGLFAVYSLAQGTVMMAVWVAAYECAGGRFARAKSVNVVFGVILSTILVIPYHSRRGGLEERRKKGGEDSPGAVHLCRALYEDVFSVFNVWRWTTLSPTSSLPVGGLTAVVSLVITGVAISLAGWRNIACWYLGPWIVMNVWLLLYHHLLHIKVQRTFDAKNGVPTDSTSTVPTTPTAEKSVDELLDDIAPEAEDPTAIAKTDLHLDPHGIAQMQREAAELQQQPLPPSSVEFFTLEWLYSAMKVFDRTILLRRTKRQLLHGGDEHFGGSTATAGSHVRFVVRLLLFLFGSLHHHLAQINVLQSIDISIPHYHALDAIDALRMYFREAPKATVTKSAASEPAILQGIQGLISLN